MKSGRAAKRVSTRVVPRTKTIKPHDRLQYWKIIRGDEVMVTSGKEKGKTGTVISVNRKLNSLIVSGLNMVYKHVPMTEGVKDGRVRKEMPIHVSNLALLHPETRLPVKVNILKMTNPETGKTENKRVVHNTTIEIPRPKYLEYQDAWKDTKLDTLPEAVRKITFEPSLAVPPLPEGVLDELRNRYSRMQSIKDRARKAKWLTEDMELQVKKESTIVSNESSSKSSA
ncbi:translation protein SH3-like domain-containing protein [Syncephalis plumigaleata]|nr:translation protein SH3-like domain-containing protein [Syncephalis plumigaleata]